MALTPDSSEELFAEAAIHWDLQKLYEGLAVAKRDFASHKRRGLTETEKKHLRGLLCDYSPAEMAKKLHKNPRGVDADLSKTIYRYVEQLTKRQLHTLRNWWDIPEWLEQTGYKIQVSDAVEGEKVIVSSPSDDIETLVQKVRSYFNETIQDEYATLCTFNLFYAPVRGNLTRMYVQTKLNESQDFGSTEFSQERQLWDEVVLRNSKLMVLGKPGAGKTTLLQYIALHCDEIEFQPKLVPLFISLKTLTENSNTPEKIDILAYIQRKYCGSNVFQKEMETLLNHGRLLFLIDGLDEVTEENFPTVRSKINNLVDIYSKNRFIVTCRKEFEAYKSKNFAQFCFCTVADFEQTQRDAFIKQWFDEVAVIAQLNRSANANELIKKLDDPENRRIQELADTPLLLHLICLIFQEKGDLPSKRVELYREAINLLLEKWNQFNERLHVDVVELRKVLRHIATITFEQGKSSFEEAEISPIIANSSQNLYITEVLSGLIIKKAWKQYAFCHQTFQEYLAAEYFVESQDSWPTLVNHIGEERWHEIFILICELLPIPTNFLLLMQREIIHLSQRNSELLYFLKKAEQKSQEIISCYNPAAIRCFYFLFSISLSDISSVPEEFLADGIFSNYEIMQLAEIIDNKFSLLDTDLENRYKVISDVEMDYRLIHVLEIARQLEEISTCGPKLEDLRSGSTSQHILEGYEGYILLLHYALERTFYFNIPLNLAKNRKIIEASQHLKSKLPDLEDRPDKIRHWWANQGGVWLVELQDWIIEYRQIFNKDLTEGTLEAAWQYYKSNQLLINCLNSSCNVSPEVRLHIKDNLFLPSDSSLR